MKLTKKQIINLYSPPMLTLCDLYDSGEIEFDCFIESLTIICNLFRKEMRYYGYKTSFI